MTRAPLAPEIAAAQRDADIAILRAVLMSTGGNVRKAAVHFGVHVSTLQRRITALGLRDEVTAAYPRHLRQPKKRAR